MFGRLAGYALELLRVNVQVVYTWFMERNTSYIHVAVPGHPDLRVVDAHLDRMAYEDGGMALLSTQPLDLSQLDLDDEEDEQ